MLEVRRSDYYAEYVRGYLKTRWGIDGEKGDCNAFVRLVFDFLVKSLRRRKGFYIIGYLRVVGSIGCWGFREWLFKNKFGRYK